MGWSHRMPVFRIDHGGALCGAAISLLAATSCADARNEGSTITEVTDSAGVLILESRIAEDAVGCPVAGELLRIGAVDEEQGTTLYAVSGAVGLSDGRIAVVNRGTSQVKVFSSSGSLLGEFGREGPGPEEFKNLWSVYVRGGDTLVVGDYRPWRFSFFSPQGELYRRVEMKPPVIERPDFAIPLAPGTGFMMEERSFELQDRMVDRIVPLWLYGEDGERKGKVGDFWLDRFGFLSREIGYVGNPIFGAKASFSYLGQDRILYATGRFEQLEIWTVAGEVKEILRWQSRDRRVGPNDATEWRRQRREAIEARTEITPEMEPLIEAQIGEHLPVTELYPGHDQVVVSTEGEIWVEEYRRPYDNGPTRWWVFGADRRFRCSVALPRDYRVLSVAGDRILGVSRDSLDVEYLVVYEVRPPSAGPTR